MNRLKVSGWTDPPPEWERANADQGGSIEVFLCDDAKHRMCVNEDRCLLNKPDADAVLGCSRYRVIVEVLPYDGERPL